MKNSTLLRMTMFSIIIGLAAEHAAAIDRISFVKKFGQVETGGPFAGAEFHGSRPLPSRISFYYPVANSIDLSTGYWERGLSAPMSFAVRIDSAQAIRLGTSGWRYAVSPHRAEFHADTAGMRCSIRYEFCFTQPAMAVTYTIRNASTRMHRFDVVLRDSLVLRTCQTYARKERAVMSRAADFDAVIAQFDEADTDSASVFVMNAGEHSVDGDGAYGGTSLGSAGGSHAEGAAQKPFCMFNYRKALSPGDSIVIVQLIGSCRSAETMSVLQRLKSAWRKDVDAYDRHVRQTIDAYAIVTGDTVLDRSVGWAAAMLASNRHYIDGEIVPMPCPAEYNFFFTHDVLLTDLAAVHFDRARVKRDLGYITSLARDSVIPHAYYWRDDGMKTEFCPPDNWNHLWFILASAAYVRHTHDDSAAAALYPFMKKSLAMLLTQRQSDGLLYAKHPDWWDIGSVEGPRAYITALTARAIGDYCFIASMRNADAKELRELEASAAAMKKALISKLWDKQAQYLINYNGTRKDEHFYAGSLVAGAYGVLDKEMSLAMAETARRMLFDPRLGVRTVAPTDFHLDSVIAYYHLAGKEAGDPYFYANGGVWPHTTAWYIWVLNAVGKKDEACDVLKRTLSVDGIMASPMGIPAMFEYRYADPSSPRYGEIDKPTFMWAAGFFLQSVYRIYGVNENEWNISFGPRPESARCVTRYPFDFPGTRGADGANTAVRLSGSGTSIAGVTIGGRAVPSSVLPLDAAGADSIAIDYGPVRLPYLESIDAVVHHAESMKGGARYTVSSYQGHVTHARFRCVQRPKRILIDGRSLPMNEYRTSDAKAFDVTFTASKGEQTIQLFH